MLIKRFPFFRQLDRTDCGATCLRMVAKYYGKSFSTLFLNEKTKTMKNGASMAGIARAAESIGFRALGVSLTFEVLEKEVPLPCIAHWKHNHFVVIYKVYKSLVWVADPASGPVKYKIEEFIQGWAGKNAFSNENRGAILVLEPKPSFYSNPSGNDKEPGFSFLLGYFKPHRRLIIQLFLGLFLGSLLQLVFPFLTQAIVDYGITYQNLNFIYIILIAQLVLFISKTSVELIRSWILLHVTSRINISLISDFLIKIMRLPIAFFDSKNSGDIIQRIFDHNRIQNFLSTTTLNTLFSILNLIVFGIVLCYYNSSIFLVFFVGSAFYIGWTLIFMKRRAELDNLRFADAANNQSNLLQLISGMQEIKLNGSEKRRRWEWEGIQISLFKNSIKKLALSQKQNGGGEFLNELKNIVITFISAKLVIDGQLTLGMMLSVQYIIGQLNLPINNFVNFIQTGQDAKISLQRLGEIHSKEDEDNLNTIETILLSERESIEFKNVSFRYGNPHSDLTLKNINFIIPSGKVTAIVGASGSGKTTLFKLILKFYKTSSGSIHIGVNNINELNASYWRKLCGVVMQNGFIFNDTIARNITESDSETAVDKERLSKSVQIANLKGFIEQQPLGYNTKIGYAGINLSEGQKQRILIARAVYKNPKYFFFDEATSALDTLNESIIMNNLSTFYEGKTVVLIAHRLSTVKNADRILVLDKGKIIESGSHDELLSRRGPYYSLVKNQLEMKSIENSIHS